MISKNRYYWIKRGLLLGALVVLCSGALIADSAVQNRAAQATPTPAPLVATFFTQIDNVGRSDVVLEMGITVVDPANLDTADNPFRAYWRLVEPDGQVRYHGFVDRVSYTTRVGGSNARYLDRWQGSLGPGTYELVWGAPGYGSTLDRFEVVYEDGRVQVRDVESFMTPRFPPEGHG